MLTYKQIFRDNYEAILIKKEEVEAINYITS